ncbi:putative C-mannosyltransferase DPY19L3 [Pitangus sulphuratus]|nr:putative C-mannosyltransferase DPY19L3 [Pitangus sulphuratus]
MTVKSKWKVNLLLNFHLQEVEREISFRTECGLYYSYYKQMIQAASIQQGLHGLVYDNKTESVRTINILERMNVYQEVFLSILYRILPIQQYLEPVYFYIYTLFGLQAVYVIALYVTSWLLSGTWLSGLLAACWYITNRVDTTRVEFTIPLRENWALPFFAVQIAAITYLLRTHLQPVQEVTWLYIIQISALLLVCVLQFFNSMILGSLLISFNASVLIARTIQKILNLESDEHIFKFLKAKFGFGATRDFDANLYLCEEAFGLLPLNTFSRLSDTLLFYVYVFVLFLMAVAAVIVAFRNLRMKYLWTSHMCVFASFGLCSTEVWKLILKCVHLYTSQRFWPGIMDELSELREFYDPDTVELMNWIKCILDCKLVGGKVSKTSFFIMGIETILKYQGCYLDNNSRHRLGIPEITVPIYQIYAKRSPEDVHGILRSFGTDYVILEDSICYERRHSRGCRLRDLLDVANGHIMDGLGENEPDLKPSLQISFDNIPDIAKFFTDS